MDKKDKLSDFLNYQPEKYFSDADMEMIRANFRGEAGAKLVALIRKALIPSISDPSLPLEEFASDSFLYGRNYSQISDSELKSIIVAREDAIKLIVGGLIKLKVMAMSQPESEIDQKARLKKDSSK